MGRRPETITRTCENCEATFTTSGRGYRRKTCSRQCGEELKRRTFTERIQQRRAFQATQPPPPKTVYRLKTPVVRPCAACGKPFENWTVHRKETCSWECRSNLLRRLTQRHHQFKLEGKPHQTLERQPFEAVCVVCGKTFSITGMSTQMTCSKKCRKAHYRRLKTVVHHKTCKECGKAFTTDSYHRMQKFCSAKCRRIVQARHARATAPKRVIWRNQICVICGRSRRMKSVLYHNASKTCSQKCQTELRRQHSLNLPPLPPETCRSIAEKMAAHPMTGHFVTNRNAKDFSLKSPDGEIFQFRNLSLFVDIRRDLFVKIYGSVESIKLKTVAIGLSSLGPRCKRRKNSWYGWTWHHDENERSGGIPASPNVK